jgi:hypothetical protein
LFFKQSDNNIENVKVAIEHVNNIDESLVNSNNNLISGNNHSDSSSCVNVKLSGLVVSFEKRTTSRSREQNRKLFDELMSIKGGSGEGTPHVSNKPFFPNASAFPVNPPIPRRGRTANPRSRMNLPVYRAAPKVIPNQQRQQQAGNEVKNIGKPRKPDKGTNFAEYENTCPSKSSSNEQKPEMKHGEHLRGELRPKKITSIVNTDPRLIRLAEEACNDQRVQDNVNHLQDELAKGNDNPGIHKKYLGNNVWEHRARGGGRLYTREIGDKVVILAKSGKGKHNRRSVLNRVKKLYVNKKN